MPFSAPLNERCISATHDNRSPSPNMASASSENAMRDMRKNLFRADGHVENGNGPAASQCAKPCLQIGAAHFIIRVLFGTGIERRSHMQHFLLAGGDLLAIGVIVLSVAYLSWKQFSR